MSDLRAIADILCRESDRQVRMVNESSQVIAERLVRMVIADVLIDLALELKKLSKEQELDIVTLPVVEKPSTGDPELDL